MLKGHDRTTPASGFLPLWKKGSPYRGTAKSLWWSSCETDLFINNVDHCATNRWSFSYPGLLLSVCHTCILKTHQSHFLSICTDFCGVHWSGCCADILISPIFYYVVYFSIELLLIICIVSDKLLPSIRIFIIKILLLIWIYTVYYQSLEYLPLIYRCPFEYSPINHYYSFAYQSLNYCFLFWIITGKPVLPSNL